MARLFVSDRELNFISDINKEFVKDIVGQKIFLFPISELKTLTHDVYNEATQKVYDNPIEVDCTVDAKFQSDTKINTFGVDATYKIEAYIQWRDLVEKGINPNIGDFFSFSDNFYEITERMWISNIYGMAENRDGLKIIGTKARESQFKAKLFGPTDISHAAHDPDAVQKKFEQQRGRAENSSGPTGDVRDLVKNGTLDESITGPKQVSEKGSVEDDANNGSAFYDEDV